MSIEFPAATSNFRFSIEFTITIALTALLLGGLLARNSRSFFLEGGFVAELGHARQFHINLVMLGPGDDCVHARYWVFVYCIWAKRGPGKDKCAIVSIYIRFTEF